MIYMLASSLQLVSGFSTGSMPAQLTNSRAAGQMGLPLGCAEIGAVLFGQEMSYNPDKPDWLNHDRFVLSAGHGSMFLYSWLHMSGYDLSMEEVQNFRAKDSKTP